MKNQTIDIENARLVMKNEKSNMNNQTTDNGNARFVMKNEKSNINDKWIKIRIKLGLNCYKYIVYIYSFVRTSPASERRHP